MILVVMQQPPNTPASLSNVSNLENYIDYDLDNCSFLSDDHLEYEEKAKSKKNFVRILSAWAEIIPKYLIRQRPKRHIDNPDHEQFISKEESEYRLLLIYIGFTLIMALTTTGLLITCPFYCINEDVLVLHHRRASALKIPHILVIYPDGRMLDYSTNDQVSPARNVSMKLSCSHEHERDKLSIHPNLNTSCHTFAYADLQRIYIFYGNAKRDLTYIDCQTFQHRTMPETRLKHSHINGVGTQVGDKFTMLGGYWAPEGPSQPIIYYQYQQNIYSRSRLGLANHWQPQQIVHRFEDTKTDTWSNRRQKFIPSHPDFTSVLLEYTCLTGFNRTHFLIVNQPFSNGEVSMVNIDTWTMTSMPRIPLMKPDSRVTCDVEFSKESFLLIAISKMHDGIDEISRMYQYNFQTEEWSQTKTNLKYFGTLKIVNGIKYFLNILNTKRHFGYYYDAKDATWMQLSIPGYYGEKLETEWQSVENVIAVMYYTF